MTGPLSGAMFTFGVSAWAYSSANGGEQTDKVDVAPSAMLEAGTGAGQADVLYRRSGTLTPAQILNMDFLGGGLTDAMGNAIALARIKAVYVRNTGSPSTGAPLNIAGNNGVLGTVVLRPGEAVMKACSAGQPGAANQDSVCWPVAAASTDSLTLTNTDGSASATYELAVVGSSA